ncbi:hypothetical protein C1T31_13420 [Hanstruepera neustonica]|uniref:SGNH/GDSL hydrolase family protein n=1 Tax=Hanstruepera neustonica TaxID=1445657 RepID=A0A2K1DVN5_9FLAO|nr:hypothetical protein [Hanstruepera neustonica]PNQ72100.1 hypothetical protein C1T31_13420 [Hanstruepera neustonica]
MKRFLILVLTFSSILLLGCYAYFYLADGSTDANYLKFTTPRQTALIIGSSRAAQGIQPKFLNSYLKRNDIYNFAFNVKESPYGRPYLKSIQRKLESQTQAGIFILEVNPWTIGIDSVTVLKTGGYRETDNFLDNTHFVALKPNIEYLIESYPESYINIFKDKSKVGLNETFFVEADGWLNVTISLEGKTTSERTEKKIIRYNKLLSQYSSPSSYRLESLENTIRFLKQHGQVYLVRMPIINGMFKIENELLSDFNDVMYAIAEETGVVYFNMMPDRDFYTYTDGNHLDQVSGRQFSINLAELIMGSRNPNNKE